MLYQLRTDLKRGLSSPRFVLAALLCGAVYFLGSVPERGAYDVTYLLDASISFSAFDYLLPIVAVLPLGCSFLDDVKSGYATFILQRTARRPYLLARFASAALLGALATVLGMLLFLASLPLSHPMARLPGPEEASAIYPYMAGIVQNRQWFFYFGFYALLQGLSGMMWSSVGLMLSSIAGNAQIIYLSVMLSIEVLCQLLFALDLNHPTVYATGAMDTASLARVLGEAACVFAGVTLLCGVGFYFLGKRRLRRV